MGGGWRDNGRGVEVRNKIRVVELTDNGGGGEG